MFAEQRPSIKILRNRADVGRHDLCILLSQPSRRVHHVSLSPHYFLLLFSTHISLSLSPFPLISSPLSQFSPLAKPVLALPSFAPECQNA